MSKSTELMRTVWAESSAHNEHRDCTVKALTVATGLPYAECHKALADAGRKPRKGAHIFQMKDAAKALGFTMERYTGRIQAKTVITAERDGTLHALGRVILSTSGHVVGMVDGNVIDWTKGRRHRIQGVYRVRRIDGRPVVSMRQFAAVPTQLELI
jgi:hypothetical protein